MEEKWKRLKVIVHDSMIREERRIKKKTIGYKCWWNRSCTSKKRLLHRKFVKWKKGKSRKDDYMKEKRRFNE